MMISDNFRMAVASLRSAKFRSFLTMLGVIIGVASVVTTVSLGEGVKRQVSGQLDLLGSDLITIRPGQATDSSGPGIGSLGILTTGMGSGSLTELDLKTVRDTEGVRDAVPLSLINAVPSAKDKKYEQGLVLATNGNLPSVLNQKVEYGTFFNPNEDDRQVAVIGANASARLFNETAPIGKSIEIRGQVFAVRGILEETAVSPFNPGPDFNNAIFIPYTAGKNLNDNVAPIYQILAKPNRSGEVSNAIASINNSLEKAHGGQRDFTILGRDDNLAVTNEVVVLLTGLIGGIAAVSLLVGGIGIMNVMLVSVSERTREIGIRKAIGATSRQIRTQFLIEAIVLSLWGAFIGLLVSGVVNFLLRVTTDFQPVITWQTIGIAAAVSVLVGAIFGAAPAFKASRKDPIEALRSSF